MRGIVLLGLGMTESDSSAVHLEAECVDVAAPGVPRVTGVKGALLPL